MLVCLGTPRRDRSDVAMRGGADLHRALGSEIDDLLSETYLIGVNDVVRHAFARAMRSGRQTASSGAGESLRTRCQVVDVPRGWEGLVRPPFRGHGVEVGVQPGWAGEASAS